MRFACPYCGLFVEVSEHSVTHLSGSAGVEELLRFTVEFLTSHNRCTQPPK